MSNNNPESPQKKLSHSLMTTVNTMENKSTVGTSFQYLICCAEYLSLLFFNKVYKYCNEKWYP